MYDSVVKAGGETEPAVDTQGPALVISVDDPQRRELPVILKINCEFGICAHLGPDIFEDQRKKLTVYAMHLVNPTNSA